MPRSKLRLGSPADVHLLRQERREGEDFFLWSRLAFIEGLGGLQRERRKEFNVCSYTIHHVEGGSTRATSSLITITASRRGHSLERRRRRGRWGRGTGDPKSSVDIPLDQKTESPRTSLWAYLCSTSSAKIESYDGTREK